MEKYFNGFYEPLFLKDINNLEYEQIMQQEQEYTDNLTQEEAYKKIYEDLCVLKQTSSHIVCHSKFSKALIKALVDLKINATVCLYLSAKDGILNYADLETFYLKVKNISQSINYAFYLPNALALENDFFNIINLCKKYDTFLVVPASNTLYEMGDCAKKNNDKTPIEVLEEMGAFNIKTIVVDCNYLEEKDYFILQNNNVLICACPMFNANMGLGFVNLQALEKHNINFIVGTGACIKQNVKEQFEFLKTINKLQLKCAKACQNLNENAINGNNFEDFLK